MFNSYVVKGLNALTSNHLHLISTFATVVGISNEGLYVNVVLDMYTLGEEQLDNIPLLKSPYLNIPIREGDRVFLTKANHLLNDYFRDAVFTQNVPQDSYIAIQCVLEPIFNQKEFTNDFTLVNPEGTFKWLLNGSKSDVMGEEIEETIKLKSSMQEFVNDFNLKSENLNIEVNNDTNMLSSNNVVIKGDNQVNINSNKLDIGNDSNKLGALLGELIDTLTNSQCIITSGSSAGSYPSLSDAGTLTALKSKIQSVFN